jgi:hypothetical protein
MTSNVDRNKGIIRLVSVGNLAPDSNSVTFLAIYFMYWNYFNLQLLSFCLWTLCLRAQRRVGCRVWPLPIPALLIYIYERWRHATGSGPRTPNSRAWVLPYSGEKSAVPELIQSTGSSDKSRHSSEQIRKSEWKKNRLGRRKERRNGGGRAATRLSSWTDRLLEMGPIGCPETSLIN